MSKLMIALTNNIIVICHVNFSLLSHKLNFDKLTFFCDMQIYIAIHSYIPLEQGHAVVVEKLFKVKHKDEQVKLNNDHMKTCHLEILLICNRPKGIVYNSDGTKRIK
jgi:hypothetical protein